MARPSSGEREGSGSEEGRETQGQAVTQYFSCQGRGSLTALLRQVPERVVFCWERRQRSAVKTHTHTDTHTDTNTHMHTYTHTCAHTHAQRHNIHTHTCTYTYTHAHTYMCTHIIYTHAHTYMHTYTHAHTCTHTYIHTRTHMHTHTHLMVDRAPNRRLTRYSSPQPFGSGDQFHGRQFFRRQLGGLFGRWFKHVTFIVHFISTLLYQLHFRSSVWEN